MLSVFAGFLIVRQFVWHDPDEAVAHRINVETASVRRMRSEALKRLQEFLDGMNAVRER